MEGARGGTGQEVGVRPCKVRAVSFSCKLLRPSCWEVGGWGGWLCSTAPASQLLPEKRGHGRAHGEYPQSRRGPWPWGDPGLLLLTCGLLQEAGPWGVRLGQRRLFGEEWEGELLPRKPDSASLGVEVAPQTRPWGDVPCPGWLLPPAFE